MAPKANVLPGVCVPKALTTAQLSVAVGAVQETIASQVLGLVETVALGGQAAQTGFSIGHGHRECTCSCIASAVRYKGIGGHANGKACTAGTARSLCGGLNSCQHQQALCTQTLRHKVLRR